MIFHKTPRSFLNTDEKKAAIENFVGKGTKSNNRTSDSVMRKRESVSLLALNMYF